MHLLLSFRLLIFYFQVHRLADQLRYSTLFDNNSKQFFPSLNGFGHLQFSKQSILDTAPLLNLRSEIVCPPADQTPTQSIRDRNCGPLLRRADLTKFAFLKTFRLPLFHDSFSRYGIHSLIAAFNSPRVRPGAAFPIRVNPLVSIPPDSFNSGKSSGDGSPAHSAQRINSRTRSFTRI